MTSPDVSPRNFFVLSASVLGWIVVLAITLKVFFGAAMNGGWIIVGMLFSAVVMGAVLMVKEIEETILPPKTHAKVAPAPKPRHAARPQTKVVRLEKPRPAPAARVPKPAQRRATAESRRSSLGLNPHRSFANRRRWPRLLVSRRGPTMREHLAYWLITANLGGLLKR